MTASMLTEPDAARLLTKGLTKAYPGTLALSDLDLDLRSGEVHGIAGQNGAGKSTLVRILSGAERPDSGLVIMDGQPVTFDDPRDAQRAQIYTVHQELSLMPSLSVAENILLGDMSLHPWGLVDWPAVRRTATASLHELGIDIDVRRPVSSLPIGHRQLVEIAKAVRRDARVLLLDEPTATLPANEVQQLFSLVNRLKERGIAIIYVSHHFDEMYEICDRVSVFRDGRKVAQYPAESYQHDAILRSMLGTASTAVAPSAGGNDRASMPRIGAGPASDDVVMRVTGLSSSNLDGIDFELHRGEVLGVSGLLGNGQSELSTALFGATPATSDQFVVNGRVRHPHDPADSISLGLGLLPEERKTQGLVLGMSVTSNITMPKLKAFTKTGFLQRSAERSTADHMREALAIKTRSLQQPVADLSGGNQQKVALAKWLASGVDILVCAEPTRGVDVGAKVEIYELLGRFVREGGSVLLVTSEIDEALMCDRVLVMRRGAVVGQASRAAIEAHGEESIIGLFS